MRPVRFVQFSDVHLDSSIGGALNLPPDKRTILRQDIAAALGRACALVKETEADIVLVPGDLFDLETVLPETATYVRDLFRSISPTPVFIAPGNHDSLWPGSPYTDSNGPKWPENVHIFTGSSYESIMLPELDCSVTGVGHAHRGLTDRLPSTRIGDRACVSFLVFHGSLEAYLPAGKETVIPFTSDELLAQGFTYAAIGHYHSLSQICDPEGNIRGAYSGCMQGRDMGETGEKCVLVGEIDERGRVTLETREVAERRVISVDVDVTGVRDNAGLMSRIGAIAAASNARACDIVCISLRGAQGPSLQIDVPAIETQGRFFHTCVNTSRVVPDYDLEALVAESAAPSLKSAFVRRMKELEEVCQDERRREILRDAVYYGLYALDGRKPEPRDAD